MSERKCPKCGSGNVDCPRTYDTRQPSLRYMHCQPICLDCGHEGERYESISEAFAAWTALSAQNKE